jgi:hypothetical protein
LAIKAWASYLEAGPMDASDVDDTAAANSGDWVYSPYASRDYPDQVFFCDTSSMPISAY